MIFPVPEIPRRWENYPLTWCLLGLNVFLFLLFFWRLDDKMAGVDFTRAENMQTTGQLYRQYLSENPKAVRAGWMLQTHFEDSEQMEILGTQALRDEGFLSSAEKFKFYGDEIRIARWQKDLAAFKSAYFGDILFTFGLHSFRPFLPWVTYQFSHSGWAHLASNMVFMVVIALPIETMIGSWGLLLVYLLGGFAGGLGFLVLGGSTVVPMVGASASVSALLSFYAFAEVRRSIRFGYFISPMPQQYGFIHLSPLLIVPLFLIVDFASLISTPSGLGTGVAYSAHVGGTLFGLVAALLWRSSFAARIFTKS